MQQQDIFFPIKTSKVIVEGKFVQRYYSVTDIDNNFLGIKKEHHFCISNNEALDIGKEIYWHLTKSNGELINAFGNPQRNWFTLLIQGINVRDYILHKRNNSKDQVDFFKEPLVNSFARKKESFEEKISAFPDSLFEEVMYEKFSNLNITIAVVNGYDIDDHLNFYLVINWKDKEQLKLLSIHRKSILKPEEVAKEFSEKLESFILHYLSCYQIELHRSSFIPILYDIFNVNSSPTTIENDDNHREKLSKFEMSCRKFFEENHVNNYASVIDFIIQSNLYEPSEKDINNWSRIKEIISVNQVYNGTKSRFKKILKDDKQRLKYEKDHQYKYESFRHLLAV